MRPGSPAVTMSRFEVLKYGGTSFGQVALPVNHWTSGLTGR